MTAIALNPGNYQRTWVEIVANPIKRIYAAFLVGLGFLLTFLGAKEWGKSLEIKGGRIESRYQGVWAYGKRFCVEAVNYENKCRGSSYWLIYHHLKNPAAPLVELAKAFEAGPPKEAAEMHDNNLIYNDLAQEKIWEARMTNHCPPFPKLERGVYSFLIGFSEGQRKAHRFAFFNEGEAHLFDPNTGLSQWDESDWAPLIKRTAEMIRTRGEPNAYFIIECYSHRLYRA